MVGHRGSSAGLYLADPTSPIPSHLASIVVTSTVRVLIVLHYTTSKRRTEGCDEKSDYSRRVHELVTKVNSWKDFSKSASSSSNAIFLLNRV